MALVNGFHEQLSKISVKELAEKLNLTIVGDESLVLTGANSLSEAVNGQLSFLDNPKYISDAVKTKASAVIISEKNAKELPKGVTALVSKAPYSAWAMSLQMFFPKATKPWSDFKISKQAFVHPSAKVGKGTSIGPFAYIGENVIIGENCSIAPNTTITFSEIGNNVIIHPGAQIGQCGFGFAPGGSGIIKIPQVGKVVIGDNVEIGANTTIDRGAVSSTVIGAGSKLDNQVQIGHGVKIGQCCILVAHSAVAGSTELGNGVIMGGKSSSVGHIKIADGVQIAAKGCVTKSIETKGITVAGYPAVPINQWKKTVIALSKLVKNKK